VPITHSHPVTVHFQRQRPFGIAMLV
jgi:hypothetical protein